MVPNLQGITLSIRDEVNEPQLLRTTCSYPVSVTNAIFATSFKGMHLVFVCKYTNVVSTRNGGAWSLKQSCSASLLFRYAVLALIEWVNLINGMEGGSIPVVFVSRWFTLFSVCLVLLGKLVKLLRLSWVIFRIDQSCRLCRTLKEPKAALTTVEFPWIYGLIFFFCFPLESKGGNVQATQFILN